jgi:hypothetical protein
VVLLFSFKDGEIWKLRLEGSLFKTNLGKKVQNPSSQPIKKKEKKVGHGDRCLSPVIPAMRKV